MGIENKAVVAIGIKVSAEEVSAAYDYLCQQFDEDYADEWYERMVDDEWLTPIQYQYCEPSHYVFTTPDHVTKVGEDCYAKSIGGIWQRLNYRAYEPIIQAFKEVFGHVVEPDDHQLDIYLGLEQDF